MRTGLLAVALVWLSVPLIAGERTVDVPAIPQAVPQGMPASVALPQTPSLPETAIPALPPTAIQSAQVAAPAVQAQAAVAAPAQKDSKKLIDTLSVPIPKMEGESSGAAAESDFLQRAQLSGGSSGSGAVSAKSADDFLVDAWQDGALPANVSPRVRAVLDRAADKAVREKLASANFKTFYLYGGFFGTKMYEAPELPGVILKTYARLPLMGNGRAWKGYSLAKERLGGLFAETTLAEDVDVTINGKKREISQALIQEKVKVEGIEGFGRKSHAVLLGMLKRGVRDNDQRRPGIEGMDQTRNLGEAPDGRFVHFDADFFAAEKSAEEGPKRVRDPPVLREAIRQAQLQALAEEREASVERPVGAVETLLDASLAGKDDARRYARRVMYTGRRRDFEAKPVVRFLEDRIARGKSIEYKKGLYVSGDSKVEDGVLEVTIYAMHHDAAWVSKLEGTPVGKTQNPSGIDTAFAQVAYGLLKGVGEKAAADPGVRKVRIRASRVMNSGLVDMLAKLGFTRERADLPRSFPSGWSLEFDVVRPGA